MANMNRKRLLTMLESQHVSNAMREYLKSLIALEITPFDDEKLLSELQINSIINEILRYNLQIKSIESVTYDYMKDIYRLLISKGHHFSIDLKGDLRNYNLIGIDFSNEVNILLNDRKNIEELMAIKNAKIKELDDYYYDNYYIYFGHLNSEEDLRDIERIKTEKEMLERQILELEYLSDNSSISRLDDMLLDGLSIKPDRDELVDQGRTFEVRKIKELGNIKVYKKQIRR